MVFQTSFHHFDSSLLRRWIAFVTFQNSFFCGFHVLRVNDVTVNMNVTRYTRGPAAVLAPTSGHAARLCYTLPVPEFNDDEWCLTQMASQ